MIETLTVVVPITSSRVSGSTIKEAVGDSYTSRGCSSENKVLTANLRGLGLAGRLSASTFVSSDTPE